MQQALDIALSYMETLDCPRSLMVAILLKAGEWDQVLQVTADPRCYEGADAYFRAAAASDFLRKLNAPVGATTAADRRARALETWWECEKECFKTNQMFLRLNGGIPLEGSIDSALLSFLEVVRKNVRRLIGSSPPETYGGKFGPGATVSDTHGQYNVPWKMCSRLTHTSKAIYHLVPFFGTAWGRLHGDSGSWKYGTPLCVPGNKFFTVPKSALTDRPCAKEPSLNSFYQLGLGKILRKRLAAHGIDLDHGQRLHQNLARIASRDNDLATIDLSSASDRISYRLVEWIMPPAWFEELDALRSPVTEVDGVQVKLEKFSSMGNGFTFELETVVFCAIAAAAGDLTPGVDLFVYGDDIIVPSSAARNVISAMEWVGFKTNERKTFIDGPFRESCGGDYFMGEPVRAHFLEEIPSEPQEYIVLANGLRRVLTDLHGGKFPKECRRPWYQTINLLPSSVRALRGPAGLGDAVIHDAEENWCTRWKDSIRYVKAYVRGSSPGIPLARWAADVVLASILYGDRPAVEYRNDREVRTIIPRDWGYHYRTGWLPYS